MNLLPEVMARTKSTSIISTHERAKDTVTHNILCSQISVWMSTLKIPLFHSLNKTVLSDLRRGRGRLEFCGQYCKQAITNIKLGLFSVHLANYFLHHHFLPETAGAEIEKGDIVTNVLWSLQKREDFIDGHVLQHTVHPRQSVSRLFLEAEVIII